jgi:hypothetical protein
MMEDMEKKISLAEVLFISSSCSVGRRGRKETKETRMEAKNVNRRG